MKGEDDDATAAAVAAVEAVAPLTRVAAAAAAVVAPVAHTTHAKTLVKTRVRPAATAVAVVVDAAARVDATKT